MGKMNVAYSDVFENLEAVINTDSDKPALSRVYDVSQSVVNKFKLNQLEEQDREYNDFIKQTQNNLEQERLEQKRLEQEKIEKERLEKQRLEQERLEKERQKEQQRLEQERLVKEKEQQRIENEKLEKQRLEQQEKERLEQEEKERLEKERREKERLEQEQQEKERLEKERQQKLLEQQEKERLEKERQQKLLEQQEKERLEQQKRNKQKQKRNKQKDQEQADRIYQKLKINTVKSTPVKTDGTKSLTNKLSNYYEKNQPKINSKRHEDEKIINNHQNYNKKLIISNIQGETLYEKLIHINERFNFNSVNLPSQYQHEQIDSIKLDKDKDSNDIINIVINKKDVDIKKVVYRKIVPIDENNKQLSDPIIQSVVFRGKYDIESDQNQWISQDLKFDAIHKLPVIHGKSCDVDAIQSLTINVQAYEDQHEINTKVIYKDMYDLIEQDKDYEVIFMSNQSLTEIDRIEHMLIKCGYVRNVYTNQVYPIRITSHNQQSILNQLNKNSKYNIKDFDIEGNRLIAYINEQNLNDQDILYQDKDEEKKPEPGSESQQETQEIQEKKSKYKPVKKEIKDAFNDIDIPKAYQYNQYNDYKPIDQHVNDMEYYNELNNRYINQFLKHINIVRKELKLSKMKKLDFDLNNNYQAIESLLKTNQNIVDNNISDIDTKIIDFCREYMNKGNSVFDFIPLQRKVGVNSKLSPEYLADRDFEQIIKRINSFKEHRELAMDREINHIIRDKSYLLTSLVIKDIYDLNQSKNNKKIAYNYSTIKIYC